MTSPPAPIMPGLPPEANDWLRDHPEVDPAGLEEVWRIAEEADPVEAVILDVARVDAMRAGVRAAIGVGEVPSAPHRVLHLVRRYGYVAAAAIVVVVAGVALWLRPVVVEAPNGTRRMASLPDGTRVELNSGSTLRYDRSFGRRSRHVALHGEAFFDVVKTGAPFVVETFNSEITVLGTRFNVRAWPGDEERETAVVLERGVVRVSSRRATAPVVLAPGQMSRVAGDAHPPTPPVAVTVDQRLSWRSGGMLFDDQPIGAILDELERRFDVPIDARPAAIRNVRMSFIADRIERPEDVLAAIARTRGYRYTQQGDGYVLEDLNP